MPGAEVAQRFPAEFIARLLLRDLTLERDEWTGGGFTRGRATLDEGNRQWQDQ